MTGSPSADDISCALRAAVPRLEDEDFVITLAQLARTSPAPGPGLVLTSKRKIAMAVASGVVALGAAGAAQAVGYLSESTPPPAPFTPSNEDLEQKKINTPDQEVADEPDARRDPSADQNEQPGGSTDADRGDENEDDPTPNGHTPDADEDPVTGSDDGSGGGNDGTDDTPDPQETDDDANEGLDDTDEPQQPGDLDIDNDIVDDDEDAQDPPDVDDGSDDEPDDDVIDPDDAPEPDDDD